MTELESLKARVDELQGAVAGLKTALRLAFILLAKYGGESPPQYLQAEVASLARELHQAGEFYAGHAISTAIPDAHIEQMQRALAELASLLKKP